MVKRKKVDKKNNNKNENKSPIKSSTKLLTKSLIKSPTKIKTGKIIDEKDEKQINSSKALLWAILILFLSFGLVFGSLWYGNYKKKKAIEDNYYNGFKFYPRPGGIWMTTISVNNQPYNIPFYYHPKDLEDIYVQKNIDLLIKNPKEKPKAIYLTIDPEEDPKAVIGSVEIARITGYKYNLLNIFTKGAVHYNPSNDTDLLVVNCEDAKPGIIVINYQRGKLNGVYGDKNNPYCINLEYSNPDDAIKVSDRFAYQLLTIMH